MWPCCYLYRELYHLQYEHPVKKKVWYGVHGQAVLNTYKISTVGDNWPYVTTTSLINRNVKGLLLMHKRHLNIRDVKMYLCKSESRTICSEERLSTRTYSLLHSSNCKCVWQGGKPAHVIFEDEDLQKACH